MLDFNELSKNQKDEITARLNIEVDALETFMEEKALLLFWKSDDLCDYLLVCRPNNDFSVVSTESIWLVDLR